MGPCDFISCKLFILKSLLAHWLFGNECPTITSEHLVLKIVSLKKKPKTYVFQFALIYSPGKMGNSHNVSFPTQIHLGKIRSIWKGGPKGFARYAINAKWYSAMKLMREQSPRNTFKCTWCLFVSLPDNLELSDQANRAVGENPPSPAAPPLFSWRNIWQCFVVLDDLIWSSLVIMDVLAGICLNS